MTPQAPCIKDGRIKIIFHLGTNLQDHSCGFLERMVFTDGHSCSTDNTERSCHVLNPSEKRPLCFLQCQCNPICTVKLVLTSIYSPHDIQICEIG